MTVSLGTHAQTGQGVCFRLAKNLGFLDDNQRWSVAEHRMSPHSRWAPPLVRQASLSLWSFRLGRVIA